MTKGYPVIINNKVAMAKIVELTGYILYCAGRARLLDARHCCQLKGFLQGMFTGYIAYSNYG